MIYVFGHLNPDSDSICSALVTADWLNYRGLTASAWRLGELNAETQFILEQAKVAAPPLLEQDLTGEKVWLVDFSEFEQGPTSLPTSEIIGLFDHHRLGSLTTNGPFDAWIRAVGCCATVVLQVLLTENGFHLNNSQATLLLGAILSDTLGLKSPTTTEDDRVAVHHLAILAGVTLETFLQQLLAAKANIQGLSANRLLTKDEKTYTIGKYKVTLSQIEVADDSALEAIMPELLAEMEHLASNESVDLYVTMVTSLAAFHSTIYFSPNTIIDPTPVVMENVVSRKKQLLPWLTDQLSNTVKTQVF